MHEDDDRGALGVDGLSEDDAAPLRVTRAPDKPWYLITARTFRVWDRLRVLVGVPVVVRFDSPDGRCHAACTLSVSLKSLGVDWGVGWPPPTTPRPPPPDLPHYRDWDLI